MIYFLFFLLFIFIAIFSTDAFLNFYTWQARIKIGRFQNQEEWRKALTKKAEKWLLNSPTIKLTDQNRLVIFDILSGNYRKNAIQHWQEAALILGLSADYERHKNPETKKKIENYIQTKIRADGNWHQKILESDGVILGYAFLQIPWLDHQKLKPAYDELWQLIQNLTGPDETVAYKAHTANYRFVDTIGFICPFLVLYGQTFKISEAVDLAIRQIEEFSRFGMLLNQNLPCHTYLSETKIPSGIFGWGRGLGWYAIGLADAWKSLEAGHPKKSELELLLKNFVKTILHFQRKNGSWGWLVTDEASVSDSSATATLAWLLQIGSGITEIQQDALIGRDQALKYLMTVTRRDGAIDFSQGDTKGIGTYSQNFDILPFTQGFCLRILNCE